MKHIAKNFIKDETIKQNLAYQLKILLQKGIQLNESKELKLIKEQFFQTLTTILQDLKKI